MMVASVCGQDFFDGGYADEFRIPADTACVVVAICADGGESNQVVGVAVYDPDRTGPPQRLLRQHPSFGEWGQHCKTRLRALARYYSYDKLAEPGHALEHHELAERIREKFMLK